MYRNHGPTSTREAQVATLEGYVRRVSRKIWKRLPMLVYALLRSEMFGVNWYSLLGLDLLGVVRTAHRDFQTILRVLHQKIASQSATDVVEALKESTSRFQELLSPLERIEIAVRALMFELETFRKSNIGKAFSQASTLSNDLVKHKEEAAEAEAALREQIKREQESREAAVAELKAELIRLNSLNDGLRQSQDKLQLLLDERDEALVAAELRAEEAESRAAGLQEELDAFCEAFRSPGSGAAVGIEQRQEESGLGGEWYSRPDDVALRQRAEQLCRKALGRRGQAFEELGLDLGCPDLAMAMADGCLYLFGGSLTLGGSSNRMKVHTIRLESGIVSEDIEVRGAAPAQRRGHYAFFCRDAEAGPAIYVCGGLCPDGRKRYNDMHCLDLKRQAWQQVVSAMPIGGRVSGAYSGSSMLLLGTSWNTGSPSIFALHSLRHAPAPPGPEPSGAVAEAAQQHLPSPQESRLSLASDWSRSLVAMAGDYTRAAAEPADRDAGQPHQGFFTTQMETDDADVEPEPRESPPGDGPQPSPEPWLGDEEEPRAEGDGGGGDDPSSAADAGAEPSNSGDEGAGARPSSTPARASGGASSDVGSPHSPEPAAGAEDAAEPEACSQNEDERGWTLQRIPPPASLAQGRQGRRPHTRERAACPARAAGSSGLSMAVRQSGLSRPQTVGHLRFLEGSANQPRSSIPGSAWIPPEDFRSWFQGHKALAKMPKAKPHRPPSRQDKRDSAAARFYGANHQVHLRWSSAGYGAGLELQGSKQRPRKHLPQVASEDRIRNPMQNFKGYDAEEVIGLDMKTWDDWVAGIRYSKPPPFKPSSPRRDSLGAPAWRQANMPNLAAAKK